MLRIDKAILCSPLLKSTFSQSVSIKTWLRSLTIFRVHKYSIYFNNWIDLSMLLYPFLVISFD